MPHAEDTWRSLTMTMTMTSGQNMARGPSTVTLLVTHPCSRCNMININQHSGDRDFNALRLLATYRRNKSRINFGQYLKYISDTASESFRDDGLHASRINGNLCLCTLNICTNMELAVDVKRK